MRCKRRREPQVGAELAVRRRGGSAPCTASGVACDAIARAASTPVSSACAMPSPVIGSTTFAASPANSTRSCVRRVDVERRGDRPRAMCAVGLRVRTEDVAHHRTIEHVAPQRRESLAARRVVIGIAQHAEADVGATVTDGEHPRVAGEELGVEDHPETRVVHSAEVLAERVPRAEVASRRCVGWRCVVGGERGVAPRSSGRRPRSPNGRRAGSVVELEIDSLVVRRRPR